MERVRADPDKLLKSRKANARISRMRRSNIDVDRWIFEDSLKEDKRCGRDFDLTRDWIKETIADGCKYCGCKELRMTLDRIDNLIGHTKANVVPACIRCNYIRRNIPHEAWLEMVAGVKKAYELGLFGSWTGRLRR